MKKMKALFLLILLLSQLGTLAFGEVSSNQDLVGFWVGELKVPGGELRLVMKFKINEAGALECKLDSPDQGVKDIPVAQTTFKNGQVELEIPVIQGGFCGILNQAGTEIKGEWKQGASYPLVMKRTDSVVEVNRPQTPKPPFPYQIKEVTYTNQGAKVKLAGTLTIPKGKGPFPAVLLITGSGAQDRDETLFNHHPFWVIADALTRRGIAVLRVDDRGVGGSTGVLAEATMDDLASDVLSGIKFLKTCPEINPRKIGLLGHSEGGVIAPLVASKTKDVSWIVLLAAPGMKGENLIRLQAKLITKAMGGTKQEVASQQKLLKMIFKAIKQGKDQATRQVRLEKVCAEYYQALSEAEKELLAKENVTDQSKFIEVMQRTITPSYVSLVQHDPIPVLKKVTCPVLALNGSKDLQVPANQNLSGIAKALKAAKNKDYTITELTGLNHLFQNCQTGLLSEYSQLEETFAPEAVQLIGDWILKRTASIDEG